VHAVVSRPAMLSPVRRRKFVGAVSFGASERERARDTLSNIEWIGS
jgi:CRISPR/Cas system endoribonuclease Cas6 (RAMP superfamily)